MKEALQSLGYDPDAYVIVGPTVVAECEKHPGHVNNVYKIFQRKIAKKFDAGSKVARLEWLEKNQIDFTPPNQKVMQMEVTAEKVSPQQKQPKEPETKDEKGDATCAICSQPGSHHKNLTDGRLACSECRKAIWEERESKLIKAGLVKGEDALTWETEDGSFTSESIELDLVTEEEFRKFFSTARAKASLAKNPVTPDKAFETPEEPVKEETKEVSLEDSHKQQLREAGFYPSGSDWKLTKNPKVSIQTAVIGSDNFDKALKDALEAEAKRGDRKQELGESKEKTPEQSPKTKQEKEAVKTPETKSKEKPQEKPKKKSKDKSEDKTSEKKASAKKEKPKEVEFVQPIVAGPNTADRIGLLDEIIAAAEGYKKSIFVLSKITVILQGDLTPAKKIAEIQQYIDNLNANE